MSDWIRKGWKWIAASTATFLAAAATLVAFRWARQKTPTDTALDLAHENIDRAKTEADLARSDAEAEARRRVAASAVEAERRARELARGAVSDPNGVLKRHSRSPGRPRD